MNVPKLSFGPLVSRVLRSVASARGGYVFNLRGKWRYETHAQHRARRANPIPEWSGEVFAYAWLSRQGKGREQTKCDTQKPTAEILALTRS